jgi:hypothetical protein
VEHVPKRSLYFYVSFHSHTPNARAQPLARHGPQGI